MLNEIYSQIVINTNKGQKIKENLVDINGSSKPHKFISILTKGNKAVVKYIYTLHDKYGYLIKIIIVSFEK